MRFLQTSDWHVGLKAAWAGDAATRIAEARLDAFRNIGLIAAEERAEFCLIAGDLFDSHAIGLSVAREAIGIIEDFPCPVYVIPGNHDQDAPGALWDRLGLDTLTRFKLLRTPAPVPIPGGTLYPCPLSRRWSASDPLAWIPPRSVSDSIRVVLAHGSLDSPQYGGNTQNPIPPDATSRYDVDYIALGDWHSTSIHPRMAYSGAPEFTASDDREPGQVLLIEISDSTSPPAISKYRSGVLSKVTIERFIQKSEDLEELCEEIAKIASPRTLLDLALTGLIPIGHDDKLQKLKQIATGEFVWSKLRAGSLIPEGTLVELPAYFPEVEAQLKNLAESSTPQAAAARLALIHLYQGAMEAGQ